MEYLPSVPGIPHSESVTAIVQVVNVHTPKQLYVYLTCRGSHYVL
jgi:hypothetical protein